MKKTFKLYLIVAVILFIITRVYGLYGHGIYSLAMESTAFVALIAGIIYILIKKTLNEDHTSSDWFTLGYNVSLALLINYLFIQGVLTIAGGSSSLESIFIVLSEITAFGTLIIWFINRLTIRKTS